jgi:phosphoserine phosphatase
MSAPINYALTFVLPKADKAQMENIARLLDLSNAKTLSRHKAFEFHISETTAGTIKAALNDDLEAHEIKVDFCLQPLENRRKSLLICDMDSTLIGQECIDELADYAGVKDRVSAITERAMRGEIDFDGALNERVGLLKDLPLNILQACFDSRIHLNKGAKILAQTMRLHGAKTVIVSGGFTFFTARVAQAAGFEHHHANSLLEDGDKLSGKVGLPILGRQAKKDRLEHYSAPLGGPQNAIAIGDGANDLAMIQAAGLGIAYYAKPAVAAAAHCQIRYTDLTSALYFQGFKADEFAAG